MSGWFLNNDAVSYKSMPTAQVLTKLDKLAPLNISSPKKYSRGRDASPTNSLITHLSKKLSDTICTSDDSTFAKPEKKHRQSLTNPPFKKSCQMMQGMQLQRILDLVGMVLVIAFIDAVFDILFVIGSVPNLHDGGQVLSISLEGITFVAPWIYNFVYQLSDAVSAVSNARRACVWFFLLMTWSTMVVMGCYLGCDLVANKSAAGTNFDQFEIFLIFLVKGSALPTTVSFALVCFFSPGIRSWFTSPTDRLAAIQLLLAPLFWLPPFLVQELHVASGANFMVMGSLHAIGWFILIGMNAVPIGTQGVVAALVTGVLMLVAGVKLLWPTGHPIPFVKSIESKWYNSMDEFLRDSKYGSAHVYLAAIVFVLYFIHALFFIGRSTSWYFMFAVLGYLVLIAAHPAKKYVAQLLRRFFPKRERFVVISRQVVPIRGSSLFAVTLVVKPPSSDDVAKYQGCGDIVVLRNWNVDPSNTFCGSLLRMCESAHYFSVVSLALLNPESWADDRLVEVKLMIQKTRRVGGMASTLIDSNNALFPNSTSSNINRVDARAANAASVTSSSTSAYSLASSSPPSPQSFEVVGFIKSNSLEALYAPSLIAFGYESGAAAFCSIFRNRMRMRTNIESLSRVAGVSELTDLIVVWTSFIRRGRGAVTVQAVVAAIKELADLQHYLYDNSGGRGVKMLFVATGVPLEWTPIPECIINKTKGVEQEVAQAFGAPANSVNVAATWNQPLAVPKSTALLGGEDGHQRQGDASAPIEVIEGSPQPTILGGLASARSSLVSFVGISPSGRKSATWDRRSQVSNKAGDFGVSMADVRGSVVNDGERSAREQVVDVPIDPERGRETEKSSYSGAWKKAGSALERDDAKGGGDAESRPDSESKSNSLHRPRLTFQLHPQSRAMSKSSSSSSLSNPLLLGSLGSSEGSDGTGMEPSYRPSSHPSFGRSSLITVKHPFKSIPAAPHLQSPTSANGNGTRSVLASPAALADVIVQVQSKEESWVPLRHALGASWSEFQSQLDHRVGSAIHWLNRPDGPDFTTLFITEHQSDVGMLRDYKYENVYDEVNRSIMENQLRYSKNPMAFMDGSMHEDGDPESSTDIATAVLYSGDYASAKKSQLINTLNRVSTNQKKLRHPAVLTFIPDA